MAFSLLTATKSHRLLLLGFMWTVGGCLGCDVQTEIKCVSDGKCLPLSFGCNHFVNCADESDEKSCGFPTVDTKIAVIFSSDNGDGTASLWKLFGNPVDYVPQLGNSAKSVPFIVSSFAAKPVGYYDSLAVDYRSATLYFADNANNLRRNGPLATESTQGNSAGAVSDAMPAESVSSITVDWLTKNTYWTDGVNIVAEKWVDSTSYSHVLLNSGIQISAIAVDPINRYLFWSDVGLEYGTITRSDLMAQNTFDLELDCMPTKLQVDAAARLVWYFDARDGVFGYTSYNGRMRSTHGFQGFATFAVHEKYVFFGDTRSATVKVYKTDDPWMLISSLTVSKARASIVDMTIFSESSQPTVPCHDVPPKERVDCGYKGIKKETCAAKGCCWDQSIRGVVWCYWKPELYITPS